MTTERARRSFSDLAKMANTPPPVSVRPSTPPPPSGVMRAVEAKSSDSGVVDLKVAAVADPSAAQRAQGTPLASTGLFEEEDGRPASQPPPSMPQSARVPAGPVSSSQPAASQPLSAPVSSRPIASAAPSQPAPAQAASNANANANANKKSSGALVLIGGVVTLAAIAAGAFFVIKSQQAKKATDTVALTAPATPDVKADDKAAAKAPPPAVTAPPADDTLAQADDKDEAPKGGPSKGPLALSKKGGRLAGPAAKPAAPQPDEPKVDPKLVAKDLPASPTAPADSLAGAMKSSVGSSDQPSPAAQTTGGGDGPQFAPGSVPQKPSQGAVTGAIGAVLPGARTCLHADDPVSRATITFGSAGAVTSVTVTGAAAGKPAEGCIKTALGKAKVPPFAQPTYSANVTVRPN